MRDTGGCVDQQAETQCSNWLEMANPWEALRAFLHPSFWAPSEHGLSSYWSLISSTTLHLKAPLRGNTTGGPTALEPQHDQGPQTQIHPHNHHNQQFHPVTLLRGEAAFMDAQKVASASPTQKVIHPHTRPHKKEAVGALYQLGALVAG